MKRRSVWLFALGVIIGALGLALVTSRVVHDEHARLQASAEARSQEDLRTGLSRMDLRFGPLLARVVARTERRGLAQSETDYEVSLPDGIALPLSASRAVDPVLLERAAQACDIGSNFAEPSPNERQYVVGGVDETTRWIQRGRLRSEQEFSNRQSANVVQNLSSNFYDGRAVPRTLDSSLRVGPLVAGWDERTDSPNLLLTRIVGEGRQSAPQTFRFAWSELEELLLAEVERLLPHASLERVSPSVLASGEAYLGDCLATVPARLVVEREEFTSRIGRSLRTTLISAWALAAGACLALGLALFASQRDATRQRRFRSAVTHELRTPLTTFRMYAEMLRAGMVPEERRQEYFETLERESVRLDGLVENVLAHARLESGRAKPKLEPQTVRALIERSRAALQRQVANAGLELREDLGNVGDIRVLTDVEMIEQVLLNLVENATKYGVNPNVESRGFELEARLVGRRVVLSVQDHGPGIERAAAKRIFRPFDRGGRDESDHVPGVGLGLSLSRDWARAAGAELTLARSLEGARFELSLPLA